MKAMARSILAGTLITLAASPVLAQVGPPGGVPPNTPPPARTPSVLKGPNPGLTVPAPAPSTDPRMGPGTTTPPRIHVALRRPPRRPRSIRVRVCRRRCRRAALGSAVDHARRSARGAAVDDPAVGESGHDVPHDRRVVHDRARGRRADGTGDRLAHRVAGGAERRPADRPAHGRRGRRLDRRHAHHARGRSTDGPHGRHAHGLRRAAGHGHADRPGVGRTRRSTDATGDARSLRERVE